MIFVFTADHHQYQSFLHEFRLRTHQGNGGNREGQVRPLVDRDSLRGYDSAIVLAWGTYENRRDYNEVMDYCASRDIPFIPVPDLKRARFFREQSTRPRF